MAIDVESLRKQLQETEREFEEARAHLYRCDGVIQYLRHKIAEAEASKLEASTPLGSESPVNPTSA